MKVNSHDLTELPQEAIDQLEEIQNILNYGKYQPQVVTAVPTFTGRLGEYVILLLGGTGKFYWCTTQGSSTWAPL